MSYFRSKGVTTVVRLNKKMYEADRFTAHGVKHHEMYFPDGTCPSEPILYRFLETVEKEPGALAVSGWGWRQLQRAGAVLEESAPKFMGA